MISDHTRRSRGGWRLSRRRFLGLAASAAGGAVLRSAKAEDAKPTLTMPPGVPRSRVVQVRSRHVVDGSTVHRVLLGEMVDAALTTVTQTTTVAEAWRTLLGPGDVIGLKFNRSGQGIIGTTPFLADALVTSLVDSGWQPDQIVCIEAPPLVGTSYATAVPVPGWDREETNFGSGSDQLASVLRQVTALIDVPFIKTHNIAGMTCALKNLSHGLVKHPARYHDHGCSPYIADIVALEPIRSKLKLCLVDALRTVFDGGPEPSEGFISNAGMILVSVDPVATDAVALGVLGKIRRREGFSQIARSPEDLDYLAVAHRRGLGIALSHGIEVVGVKGA